VKFEVFTAMKTQIEVFRDVTPCSVGYMSFSHRHSLHTENGGNKLLRNVGILPHNYTASQPRGP